MSHLTYSPETGLSLGELEPTPTSLTQTEIAQQPQDSTELGIELTSGQEIAIISGLTVAFLACTAIAQVLYKRRSHPESLNKQLPIRVVEDQ